MSAGAGRYRIFCSACHGEERQGIVASAVPALIDVSARLSRAEIASVIKAGKGMMPGFSSLPESDLQVLVDYLLDQEKIEGSPGGSARDVDRDSSLETPYELEGYVRFVDRNGYPAINPPWGTLSAIDLNTGDHLWQIPLGEFKELTDQGYPPTGTENYGGPIVTEGGLLFIAASKDGMFRAFDKSTGRMLWEYLLPAPGFATPATYQVGTKQFVVIAAGGGKLGTTKGDSYIAFALP
jgi:quinoprotein glucose dehydrogenase